MKKKIIKYLLILFLIVISFGAGFGTSEYWRKKNRPVWSSMASSAGTCAYQDKDITTALKDYYGALFLDPSNSEAHLGLGYLFYDQGLYDLSLDEFGKYLQNPSNGILTIFSDKEDRKTEKMVRHDIAWTYCYIGDIYEKKGDKANSIKNYKKAIESDPEYIKYLEAYIKFIKDKKEEEPRHYKKLDLLNKTLSRIREAEEGT